MVYLFIKRLQHIEQTYTASKVTSYSCDVHYIEQRMRNSYNGLFGN